jgi:hypothetical protein
MPYKLVSKEKEYKFIIRNVQTREYGDKATYYVFIKEEI